MDILSEILSTMQIQSFALGAFEMSEPWRIDYGAEGAMVFHFVSAGSCWLRQGDKPPVLLSAGHALLLPTWARIALEAPLDVPDAISIRQLVAQTGVPLWSATQNTSQPVRLRHGGQGPRCEILSGVLAFDRRQSAFLFSQLADVIHLDTRADNMRPWLARTFEFLADEAQNTRPGYEAAAARLTDLILVQLLREHIHFDPKESRGWIKGLSDAYVAKALIAIHRDPARKWSVAELGREVGLSRTGFALRFRDKAGMTPLRYVARWRLHLGATQLMQTDRGVEEISARIGYGSSFAFSRAFQQQYGMTPGAFRKMPAETPFSADQDQ